MVPWEGREIDDRAADSLLLSVSVRMYLRLCVHVHLCETYKAGVLGAPSVSDIFSLFS